ncbi:sorting nexin-16-like [Ptychodera flava]|uniref:sorting nexin-16-like n=1 Tax=Ptychodera flava TaxID=63121 RepID=UPI003969F909
MSSFIASDTDTVMGARIVEAHIIGDNLKELNGSGTVFFTIEVKSDGPRWTVKRRYSEFKALLDQLKKDLPGVSFDFPGKLYLFDNYDTVCYPFILGIQQRIFR